MRATHEGAMDSGSEPTAPAVGRGGEAAMDDEPQAWAWTDLRAKMM